MTVYVTDDNIYLRQGDTGQLTFSGFPTDKAYSIYLSIYNPDTETIIAETQAALFDQTTGVATVVFNETFSNSLPVGDWTYGLKMCADGTEDTLIPRTDVVDGKLVRYNAPRFTVGEKYVEGA